MKKRWIPLAIVGVLAAVLFFSRSIYNYTLPKIMAETAAPGQFQYRLSVQRAALEGEGAYDVILPAGLAGRIAFGSMPVLGETFNTGDVILPMSDGDRTLLADAAALRRGEIAAVRTAHANALSASRRRLRQLDAQIPELESILAAECTELPELEQLAKQIKRAGGSRRDELQKQYDDLQRELIARYTDTLEACEEEHRTVSDSLVLLEAGYCAGQSIAALDGEDAALEMLEAMLADGGMAAPGPVMVAAVYGASGSDYGAGDVLLRLLPASASAHLVIEAGAAASMGDFASSCTAVDDRGRTLALYITEREITAQGLRLVMEPTDAAVGGNWTQLLLKGPMETCVIPASALIGGAGVYRVSEWEDIGGAQRLQLYYIPVTVGQIHNGQAVIEAGIYSGDKVVTAWDRAIWDGAEAAWAR